MKMEKYYRMQQVVMVAILLILKNLLAAVIKFKQNMAPLLPQI